MRYTLLALALLAAAGCGDTTTGNPFVVTWKFASGDCTTNNIKTVQVTATPGSLSGSADCSAGRVTLAKLAKNGTYSISAKGLDAGGIVRAENFGMTVHIAGGAPPDGFEVTLNLKTANVTVNWYGCPNGVILPYYVTLYKAGGQISDAVANTQESCTAKTATLSNVPPGSYIADLDDRAVTPAVHGSAPVTVYAGEDTSVTIPLQ